MQTFKNLALVLRPTNISFELKKYEGSYQAYVESVYCDICFRFSDKDEKDDPSNKKLKTKNNFFCLSLKNFDLLWLQ